MTTIFSLLLSEKELPNCILDFGDGLMVSHSSQGQNGPIPQFVEIFSKKNTVLEINGKVPLFLELEFQKLEFHISFATVALLSWICAIKKIFALLELGKLEYHLHSTRVYQA